MVGEGSRFLKAGYNQPKFKIPLAGKTLFNWSVTSLAEYIKHGAKFIFITQKKHDAKDFISEECKKLNINNFTVIELKTLTKGQAETVLHAAEYINKTEAIAIYNIDTHVNSSQLPYFSKNGVDGIIPCFTATEDKWSFVRSDANLNALEVREKQPISTNATIGFYWFSSFTLYEDAYKKYYSQAKNIEKNELYIAPLYNQLIKDGKKVTITLIDKTYIINLGTPQELDDARKIYE